MKNRVSVSLYLVRLDLNAGLRKEELQVKWKSKVGLYKLLV